MHTSTIAHQKSMGKAEHDRQEASGHKADDAAAAAAPHNPGATDLRGGGDAGKHSSRDTVNAMKERQHAKVVSAAAAGGGGGVSEKQHTTTTTTAPDKHKETVREHEKEQDQWVGHGKGNKVLDLATGKMVDFDPSSKASSTKADGVNPKSGGQHKQQHQQQHQALHSPSAAAHKAAGEDDVKDGAGKKPGGGGDGKKHHKHEFHGENLNVKHMHGRSGGAGGDKDDYSAELEAIHSTSSGEGWHKPGYVDPMTQKIRHDRQRAHDLELEEESVGFGFIFGVGVMALLGTYGKRIKRCLVAKAKENVAAEKRRIED